MFFLNCGTLQEHNGRPIVLESLELLVPEVLDLIKVLDAARELEFRISLVVTDQHPIDLPALDEEVVAVLVLRFGGNGAHEFGGFLARLAYFLQRMGETTIQLNEFLHGLA